MVPYLILLAVLAVLVWFQWKFGIGWAFRRGPLWLAFSGTLAALLFIGAGAAGYNMSRYQRSVEGTAWRDGVIWWEVWIGVAFLVIAVAMWQRGLQAYGRKALPTDGQQW
jgi:hypothetical protein